MSEYAVLDHVEKVFGDRTALSVDALTLGAGEIVALIGPNGAGKTTLLRVMSGLWLPTRAQRLEVLGADLLKPMRRADARRWRAQIGFASSPSQLFGTLTVRENLEYVCHLYGIRRREREERVAHAMALCNVADRGQDQVWTLSTGLRQRVNISRALVTDPRLVFLDEPTSGLDPLAAHDVYAAVRRLRSRGVTVLLSTHLMSEVDDLCDRAIFLSRGRVMADASPDELRAAAGEVVYQLHVPSGRLERVVNDLGAQEGVRTVTRSDDGLSADVIVYGLRTPGLLDATGLTYTRRGPQLADTFWLLGGDE